MRYPQMTQYNLEAWEDITYSFIIVGMNKQYPDVQYGELMRKADALTIRLFRALKRDMRRKRNEVN